VCNLYSIAKGQKAIRELGFLGNHVLNGAVYSLPSDLLNDFAPISPLVTFSNVFFAKKAMPAKDLEELIGWLKANPNKATAGVTAAGRRLLAAFFQKETGTQVALVPYRGTPPQCRTWRPVRSTCG
jgi:tripartite-type tricarboxylate transporter receptor subunit TctC